MKSPAVKIFLHVVINAIAIYVSVRLVNGLDIEASVGNLLLAGLVFGIVNTLVKPIAVLMSLPFIILTFGLFGFVINIFLLFLVSFFIPSFTIAGFWPAFWGVLIISLVNYFLVQLIEE